jgi:hypothetical protein
MGVNINITGGLIIFGFVLMVLAFLLEKQTNQPDEYSTIFFIGIVSAFVGIAFKVTGRGD